MLYGLGLKLRKRQIINEPTEGPETCPHLEEAVPCDDPTCYRWQLVSLDPCAPRVKKTCGPGTRLAHVKCVNNSGEFSVTSFHTWIWGYVAAQKRSNLSRGAQLGGWCIYLHIYVVKSADSVSLSNQVYCICFLVSILYWTSVDILNDCPHHNVKKPPVLDFNRCLFKVLLVKTCKPLFVVWWSRRGGGPGHVLNLPRAWSCALWGALLTGLRPQRLDIMVHVLSDVLQQDRGGQTDEDAVDSGL